MFTHTDAQGSGSIIFIINLSKVSKRIHMFVFSRLYQPKKKKKTF